ncbi:MAG: class I SAM-dependent methyltransferase [Geobacteraceae bacterium]|nr:MAG: class I SAM-dependent methyltransferase [Geobacteraceae bacterium]
MALLYLPTGEVRNEEISFNCEGRIIVRLIEDSLEGWLPPRFTGETVLEIACGTGYWTKFIAPSAAHIVAVDSAPETIRIAKERVPEGIVQFVVGDAYALPVHLGEFSAAFAGFWFSHVPKA